MEPLSGYLTLCEKLQLSSLTFAEAFKFGPDESDTKSVKWIIHRMCELWGNGTSFEIDKSNKPYEANYLKLDCSKAKRLLDWHVRWDLEKSLEMIVLWTKSHQNNEDMRKVCLQQIEQYFLLD